MEQWHFGFGILFLFGLVGAEMVVWGAYRVVGRSYWFEDEPEPQLALGLQQPLRLGQRATEEVIS